MEPILTVEHLSKTFSIPGQPDLVALDDISFSLYPNEILGIVGESGCGKSTLAKTITRLQPASGGTITIAGRDVGTANAKTLREIYQTIQMVFQSPIQSFHPRRTLGQSIGDSFYHAGLSCKEISSQTQHLLQLCGLSGDFAARYPHEVSGGECQRAAIARALAPSPQILIFDEATSALDVTVQQQILSLLKTLQASQGMSYLFISHSLALMQQFCTRVLVLHAGKIVEQGTPDDVIFHPKSEITKQLIDAVLE